MDGVDVVYMPPLPLATITCRAKPDQDAGDFPASKYFCLFDLYSNKNTANDAGATANPGEFTNRCSGTHEAALPCELQQWLRRILSPPPMRQPFIANSLDRCPAPLSLALGPDAPPPKSTTLSLVGAVLQWSPDTTPRAIAPMMKFQNRNSARLSRRFSTKMT